MLVDFERWRKRRERKLRRCIIYRAARRGKIECIINSKREARRCLMKPEVNAVHSVENQFRRIVGPLRAATCVSMHRGFSFFFSAGSSFSPKYFHDAVTKPAKTLALIFPSQITRYRPLPFCGRLSFTLLVKGSHFRLRPKVRLPDAVS